MVQDRDNLISEYEHERQRPRSDEALHILRRVATMVKPLMRPRGWHVRTLAEFYPDQTNLLGLNWDHGRKICLRLRYATDERQFLPFENVVDTMLHELAHIVHGDHDQHFHALWDQLRDEHEALLRRGYTGEGFLSKGRKLGGRLTAEEARRQQRAQIARLGQSSSSGEGGRKLGGRKPGWNEDIRQVIADAAERRKQITQGCVSSNTERSRRIVEETSRNGFRTQAEEDEANEKAIMDAVIDLIQQEERERLGDAYVPPSQENPAGSKGTAANPAPAIPLEPPPVPLSTKPAASASSSAEPELNGWPCPTCTFFNPANYLCCDICGSEQPSSLSPSDYADDNTQGHTPTSPPTSRRRPESSSSSNPRPSKRPARASDDTVLRPRSSKKSLAKIYESQALKPLGWNCSKCGSFMETEWWTCSMCGQMKESS